MNDQLRTNSAGTRSNGAVQHPSGGGAGLEVVALAREVAALAHVVAQQTDLIGKLIPVVRDLYARVDKPRPSPTTEEKASPSVERLAATDSTRAYARVGLRTALREAPRNFPEPSDIEATRFAEAWTAITGQPVTKKMRSSLTRVQRVHGPDAQEVLADRYPRHGLSDLLIRMLRDDDPADEGSEGEEPDAHNSEDGPPFGDYAEDPRDASWGDINDPGFERKVSEIDGDEEPPL